MVAGQHDRKTNRDHDIKGVRAPSQIDALVLLRIARGRVGIGIVMSISPIVHSAA